MYVHFGVPQCTDVNHLYDVHLTEQNAANDLESLLQSEPVVRPN